MAQRDLYETLGVPRGAPEDQIRKAYRELARKHHPDRNPGNAAAEEKFKEASYASDVLLNKEKRKLYDEFGFPGLREGFDPAVARRYAAGGIPGGSAPGFSGNIEDLLNQMGFAARQRRGGPPPGGFAAGVGDLFNGDVAETIFGRANRRQAARDVVSDVAIDFADAVRGAETELSLAVPGESPRTLKVRIPPGVADGGRIRLRGQAPGGGDILLNVHVREHPCFTRNGDDLELELPVTVGEAIHGAKVEVPTPEGAVSLTIPKGVKAGAKLRLRGRGVKRSADKRGDLLVRVRIVLPDDTSSEEVRSAIDTLEGAYGQPVRRDVSF